MYLLDTNICIDFALGHGEALRLRMRAAVSQGLAMSAITYGELAVGSRQSDDPAQDMKMLLSLTRIIVVQPFDQAAADAYGRLARMIGVRRKSFDRLIAAHAISLDLTLVTNNEAGFAAIPGLRLENWTL